MDYRQTYIRIISKAKQEYRKKNQGIYYESHHILPKSLFPKWAKRKSNFVLLTAREHFFCHQLLEKIYPGEKMFCALWFLANDGQNNYCVKGSREYERLKIRASLLSSQKFLGNKINQGRKQSPETLKKRSISLIEAHRRLGKNFLTEKGRKNIVEANTGRKHSEETKKKISVNRKGISCNKGIVRSEETKAKVSKSKKEWYKNGGTVWNKGVPMEEDARLKVSISKKEWYKNGGTVWNKGRTLPAGSGGRFGFGTNHPQSIKVRCHTGEEFPCVNDALKFAGMRYKGIIPSIKSHKPFGKHPITKEPLMWEICNG